MQLAGHQSLQRVAELSKGYPLLVVSLCAHYGIPIERRRRFSFIADVHLAEIAWRVDEHKRRPRLSRRRYKSKFTVDGLSEIAAVQVAGALAVV
jgi:hypothetical protein